MQPGVIRVGTSGWKFDDWAGTFYPLRVAKSKWLEYYAARFDVGEINSSYYHIASTASYAAINERTPDTFRVFIKAHAAVTHDRVSPKDSMAALVAATSPLRKSGKLLGYLAQFPGSFKYDTPSLAYVLSLAEYCDSVAVCVEFRSRSWMRDNVLQTLDSSGIIWVSPDEPDLPELMPFKLMSSGSFCYVRLHGRNSEAWYDQKGEDRYNYEYSEEQLTDIGRHLLSISGQGKNIFVFFNNCHLGQAPRNALWMKQWLAAQQEESD